MSKAWMYVIVFACCLAISSELQTKKKTFLYCNVCGHVNPYNDCVRNQDICTAAPDAFCYTRMVSKDAVLQFIDRGCVSKCVYQQIDEHYRNLTYCCNDEHFCNNYSIWPQ